MASARSIPTGRVYSSQDSSGWYCVPEVGDRVRIYCSDGEDGHSLVQSSVHDQVAPALLQQDEDKGRPSSSAGGPRASGKAGGYSGLRDAPEVKSMTYGSKEIRLTPEGVYLIVEDSVITMTAASILVMSENNIAIKSDKSISVSATGDINITGAEGVALMCGGSTGLVIIDDVKVAGAVVNSK